MRANTEEFEMTFRDRCVEWNMDERYKMRTIRSCWNEPVQLVSSNVVVDTRQPKRSSKNKRTNEARESKTKIDWQPSTRNFRPSHDCMQPWPRSEQPIKPKHTKTILAQQQLQGLPNHYLPCRRNESCEFTSGSRAGSDSYQTTVVAFHACILFYLLQGVL